MVRIEDSASPYLEESGLLPRVRSQSHAPLGFWVKRRWRKETGGLPSIQPRPPGTGSPNSNWKTHRLIRFALENESLDILGSVLTWNSGLQDGQMLPAIWTSFHGNRRRPEFLPTGHA